MSLLSEIPAEVLTGLVSAGTAAWGKLQAQKNANQALAVEALAKRVGTFDASANAAHSRGGEWTRRVLAIMAGSFIFGIPCVLALAQLIGLNPITTVLYTQAGGGFWIFGKAEQMYSAVSVGNVITPLHTHLGSMIMGYYFGAGIVKSK